MILIQKSTLTADFFNSTAEFQTIRMTIDVEIDSNSPKRCRDIRHVSINFQILFVIMSYGRRDNLLYVFSECLFNILCKDTFNMKISTYLKESPSHLFLSMCIDINRSLMGSEIQKLPLDRFWEKRMYHLKNISCKTCTHYQIFN